MSPIGTRLMEERMKGSPCRKKLDLPLPLLPHAMAATWPIDIDRMLLDLLDGRQCSPRPTSTPNTKTSKKMPDGYITASLVRSRRRKRPPCKTAQEKSKLMVAFGACSAFGGTIACQFRKGGMGKIAVYGRYSINSQQRVQHHNTSGKHPLGGLTLPKAEQR